MRPPVRLFLRSSDFSGVVEVTSAKSETVWNRRPGLVGLRLRSAISTCLEDLDLALGEGDDGPLGVGQLDLDRALASPLGLALAVGGVHLADLDLGPDRLDRVADLGLGRRGRDHERVDAVVEHPVGLLAHDRAQDDVAGILHADTSVLVAASEAAAISASAAGERRAPDSVLVGTEALVKITTSDTSTS